MAKDGDLVMGALTNTRACPERRIAQIVRHRQYLMRQWESFGEELFVLTESIATTPEDGGA